MKNGMALGIKEKVLEEETRKMANLILSIDRSFLYLEVMPGVDEKLLLQYMPVNSCICILRICRSTYLRVARLNSCKLREREAKCENDTLCPLHTKSEVGRGIASGNCGPLVVVNLYSTYLLG